MRRSGCVALAALLILIAVSTASAKGADPQTETEVKAFLDNYALAYEKKDFAAITAMIAPDADVVFVDPGPKGRYVGPEQIKKSYENDFTQFKSLSTKYTWISVGAKGDLAWFTAESISAVDMGEEKLNVPARWTGLLEKRQGKWVLIQSHFSVVEPEMEPEPEPEKKPN
ncbi:MAG: nuclear transport factor 2 family protein [Desulfomonile tiedjei]|uniref:Nuclear transport factor 2 family protein n=1 Tax=Desulfomonile tiedjei TaxID=2358 RepID=A0A9D6V6B5_9BACT|nr:nuclear transport factor 2 family protein [Desulfomonile tiedjei]